MNPARRTTAAAATAVVLATAGTLLSTTAPAAAAPVSCASPAFTREFFANTTFSGRPRATDCDSAIDQNWRAGAPASGLPRDNFGVRWSVTRDFGSGGPFTLRADAQDGIRVHLDGVRRIDLWSNVSSTRGKTVNLTVPAGKHTLRVDFVNWTGNADVDFTYTPRTSASVDKVEPLAPRGASAAYDKGTRRTRVAWSKSPEMDLAGYRVYRRAQGASFGTRPLATTTSTSYSDTTVPATGATYLYEVRAYDRAGNESAGTADQSVVTTDRTPPPAPAAPTALSEYDGIRLTWPTDPAAASYRVYRATGTNGAFTRIADTARGTHLDTRAADAATHTYRITALDRAGNESGRSAPVSVFRRDLTAPPAVTGLRVTPTGYGFALTWDASRAPDAKTYVVHWGELMGDEEEQICYGSPVEYLAAGTTSHDYLTLPDGDEVCFFVDVLDTAGNSSLRQTGTAHAVTATEIDTTPGVPTPEGSPLRVTAHGAGGTEGNTVSWSGLDPSSPQAARGYRVHRWNPVTARYEKIADIASGTSYTDTRAGRGTTSYYWVTAVAADGTESLPAGDWAVSAPAR
ncbi:cellulose 1,4-beta-cellobiosidase [Streptomyces clavuligerus]|uniref:PA14 domain protein n=2 Tax=Streptomyces clavuligerus TaxID=1901 RepID=E2Q2M1_STRCL|nr:PA14 domain-containing protein [Streptomyces clavuligerus]ANW16766.1 cellulose 1,4-beta-cellobiosidase [Streptomyces clavuligerus]AXU11295.1 cellulose 1,4-beta-cellobiosidase [Streptomyces clavuligerus]EFG10732.1 PA14 domain protein [Streptomyces clavuligerus]MBY6301099.1 cellulose 1,4-beta-cellobiosidase [Streptomyces clavuligerus]QCS04163.1 cellulose 1,4-beta-cellobiosidase [Streptomyces clavuligerus]